MNLCIKRFEDFMETHPKAKQWLWFVVLWCGGLFTALAAAYPIKWLMKHIG